MFNRIRTLISGGLHFERAPVQCRKYEARLEDYLQGVEDSDLGEHLTQCAGCRTALEDSRLAGQLLRDAWEPTSELNTVAGVMARIREQQMRTESPAAFWNPIEFLASRVSLTAAALLLAMSVYMVGFAPRRAPTLPPSARTELRAADFPQPPGDPDSNEEVLQSLGETDYGN